MAGKPKSDPAVRGGHGLRSEVSTYGTTIEYNIRVLQYFIWADDPSFFLSTESNHREEKVR